MKVRFTPMDWMNKNPKMAYGIIGGGLGTLLSQNER